MSIHLARPAPLIFAGILVACGSSDDGTSNNPTDSGVGTDSTIDSGVDSTIDSSTDARDSSVDADAIGDAPKDTTDAADAPPDVPITPIAPGDAGCTVTAGDAGNFYITGVALMRPDVVARGEVMITGGTITCADVDCSSDPAAATATKLACTKGIVLPGYVDPHNHVDWNVLPQWKHAKYYEDQDEWNASTEYHNQIAAAHTAIGGALECDSVKYAEVRAIAGGTTSIQGTSVAGATLPCITGLVRNIELGAPTNELTGTNKAGTAINPVTSASSAATTRSQLASGALIAYEPHVGEGFSRAQRTEIDIVEGHGLLGPKTAIIHGAAGHALEYRKLAATGTKLIWSPRSNLDLYGDTAHVQIAKALGVEIAIGCDWSPSGSWQIPEEMRCAREVDDASFGNAFTDEELVAMTTVHAANAMGVGDKIGKLAPGYVADVQIVAGDPDQPAKSAVDAGPNETALVFVGGKPLYGETSLLTKVVADATLCDAVPLCSGVDKTVCLKRTSTDDSLDTVTKALSDALATAKAAAAPADQFMFEVAPLVRCSKPVTCDVGNTAWPHAKTATDADGDTIPDASDSCPSTWNPLQDDFDGDGKGDECDECPNVAGTTCGIDDLDGDGTPNATDACPFVSGTDPTLCATCGTTTTACEIHDVATVRDPSQPRRLEMGALADFTNLVVVGQWKSGTNYGVWLADPTGKPWGGMFAFYATTAVPAGLDVGTLVEATGTMSWFNGLIEIVKPTGGSLTLTPGGTASVPAPLLVTVKDVWTGGPKYDQLQGMLIELHDVDVVADTPFVEVEIGDETGFGGTMRLQGTAMGVGTPSCAGATFTKPAVGTKYSKIVGVLDRRNAVAKILPRCPDEMVTK